MNSDRVLGLAAIAVAGAMTAAAWNYVAPISYEPVGPRAFPLVLALLIALCGAWLVAKPGETAGFARGAMLQKIALCAATVVVYALLFQSLGFIVATALMCVPVGRIFGGSWKRSAQVGVIMGIALYLFFDKLLDVVLPLGILKPVFIQLGL